METEKLKRPGYPLLTVQLSDIDQIRTLQPNDWPDISIAYSYYINSWFCKPLKLMEGDEIFAVGNIISFDTSSWLAQIIVKESFRGQGWGVYLTQQLMENVPPLTQTISLLATPMGEPVYLKLGFQPESVYTFFRKQDTPFQFDSNIILPMEKKFTAKLFALDLLVSGEDRSRLISEHLDQAMISINNEEVVGYYLPTLGDGLIVSLDEEVGLNYIKMKLNSKNLNIVPEENKIASTFLLKEGYDPYRKATRMVKGKSLPYHPQFIYSRIGGNLG